MSEPSLRFKPSIARWLTTVPILLVLGMTSAPLHAGHITDATGDFLLTFAGSPNGDLDVISADALFDGTNFTFRSTQAGSLGSSEGGTVYVWGVDTGLHNPFFGSFRPGVLFDIAVVFFSDGSGLVADFNPDVSARFATVTLAPGAVTFSSVNVPSDTIQGIVPLSLLPSRGLQPDQYQVNLWPRTGLNPADNTQISDFAPENSDFAVAPEPATLLFLVGGLAAFALRSRR